MRTILQNCLAFLLLCLTCQPAPAANTSTQNSIAQSCRHFVSITNVELQDWYRRYNEEYFGNALAKDVVVRYADLSKEGNIGKTVPKELNGTKHDRILIDRETNVTDNQVQLTLLHEMCHEQDLTENVEDGPKWGACMLRLASEGAFQGLW